MPQTHHEPGFETFKKIVEALEDEEDLDLSDPTVMVKLGELKSLLVEREPSE